MARDDLQPSAASHRQPNGLSTTTTWLSVRSSSFATICPLATIGSCQSWLQISLVFLELRASRGLRGPYGQSFQAQLLGRFVAAYQQVETLTIGELWALASMLRVVLLENLRRCADRIVSARAERERVDTLADRLLGSPARPAEPVEKVLGRYRKRKLPRTLAVQLVQRLKDCDPTVTPAFQHLEELLRADGVSADEVVRDELQRQGAANVTVRNIVTSLVQLSALDWADIVEQLSHVDALLGAETDFSGLDFATRNRYRSAVEEIARDSRCAETEVARRAIAATLRGDTSRAAAWEVGYYLIGPGVVPLKPTSDIGPLSGAGPWRTPRGRCWLPALVALPPRQLGSSPTSCGNCRPPELLLLVTLLPASQVTIALVIALRARSGQRRCRRWTLRA